MRICKNIRTAVNGIAHAVENTAEHIFRNCQLLGMTEETDFRLGKVDALCRFKQLNDSLLPLNLKHFAAANLPVRELQFTEFIVGDIFHPVNNHQRAGDFFYGFIFLDHSLFPPAATALISASISFSMAA